MAMTPEAFEEAMQQIKKADEAKSDHEGTHSQADDLMCKLLRDLGYAEGVKVYNRMERWHA